MLRYLYLIFLIMILVSCTKKVERPVDCVQEFIIAAREHDIPKAWALLGPEAMAFYNDIGEKNRKSGKGILEHDISEITKFRSPDSDYRITTGKNNGMLITMENNKNEKLDISIIESGGGYKIKDAQSVRNIINSIASERVKKDYY